MNNSKRLANDGIIFGLPRPSSKNIIMKKIACILSFSLVFLSAKSVEKETRIDSKIDNVTLFTQGAQIFHTAKKSITAGRQFLVFTDLPQGINANSIQVGGNGDLMILSVTYRLDHLSNKEQSPKVKILEDSVKLLTENLTDLNNQIWLYTEEKDLLLKNKIVTSAEGSNSTDDLVKRANFFRSRMNNIFDELSSIQKKQKWHNERITALRRQISELRNGGIRKGEIVVEIDAKKTSNANFEFSYTINNAGWYPVYDIRASSVTEPLKLSYNAKVYQSTGQDWENINLTLSSAAPLSSIAKPTFAPWRLQFIADVQVQNYSYSNRMSKMSTAEAISADKAESDDEAAGGVNFQAPLIAAVNHQTSTSFSIKVPYNVPSDGKHHSVNVAEYEIPADYTYFIAPKSSSQAFLLARAANWYKYNFLPGQANIFFENTYVGNTVINMNSATDTLDISLGIDRGLIVKRERLEDFCKTRSFGSTKKESIGIGITIVNNRNIDAVIEVVDQIPVSSDNNITVELLESDKAKYDVNTGKLLWNVSLKPGKSELIKFKYSVEYPKDRRINL